MFDVWKGEGRRGAGGDGSGSAAGYGPVAGDHYGAGDPLGCGGSVWTRPGDGGLVGGLAVGSGGPARGAAVLPVQRRADAVPGHLPQAAADPQPAPDRVRHAGVGVPLPAGQDGGGGDHPGRPVGRDEAHPAAPARKPFYYLHILLLVYAFVPVARVFVRSASRRDLEYLLAVWFVTGILFPCCGISGPSSW